MNHDTTSNVAVYDDRARIEVFIHKLIDMPSLDNANKDLFMGQICNIVINALSYIIVNKLDMPNDIHRFIEETISFRPNSRSVH